MAGRIWVEAWSPEYGTSYGIDSLGAGPDDAGVAIRAEPAEPVGWGPVTPEPAPLPPLAFLDGVSRVDARLFVDTGQPGGPAGGLCGSVGVGAMTTNGATRFGPMEIHRAAIFPAGGEGELPAVPGVPAYEPRQALGPRPEDVRLALERLREAREGLLAAALADAGHVVIADGRLRREQPLSVIGYIKSHEGRYLGPELAPAVAELAPGQRTPVFALTGGLTGGRHHYSWYLRLAPTPHGHPWAGVARCEVSASLPLPKAVELAELTAAHLPRFASRPYWDSRSPQNLVPIATLERRLWHLLGDRELTLRRIRSAAARQPEAIGA